MFIIALGLNYALVYASIAYETKASDRDKGEHISQAVMYEFV